MSCWVVPAVAAEFWGVTVDTVLHRVRDGQVPHKTDQGFLFVDVAPWSMDAAGARHHRPPPTFVPVPVEVESSDEEDDRSSHADELNDEQFEIDDEETPDFNWHSREQIRKDVSRRRRPPLAA